MSHNPLVVLGGSGFVGSRLVQLWRDEFRVIAPTHAELDVLDNDALAAFLKAQADAESIVNLVAWADVDGAEAEAGDTGGRVYSLNATYPTRLARLCGELNKHLTHVSTDYVFDGTSTQRPYAEHDSTHALCWYAETKLHGERGIVNCGTPACIARIEMPFSAQAHPKRDLARLTATRLLAGQRMRCVVDQRITPVFLDDAARALHTLARARYAGMVHIASADWTTPYDFARSIATRLGGNAELLEPEQFEVFSTTRPARRPQHSWLDVSLYAELFGGDILRPVEAELDVWAEQALRSGPAQTVRS